MENTSAKLTPMATNEKLKKEENSKDIGQKLYRGMIGSLLYITSSRHDLNV
jgi:hypothetical protein